MEDIRSFIAIEVPRELKSKLEEVQRELRRTEADVKWVRPEAIPGFHTTGGRGENIPGGGPGCHPMGAL
jgi:hypothetical protein